MVNWHLPQAANLQLRKVPIYHLLAFKSSAKTKAKSIAVATTLGQHVPNPRLLGPQQAPVQHSYSL
jgi:hypothetical protein